MRTSFQSSTRPAVSFKLLFAAVVSLGMTLLTACGAGNFRATSAENASQITLKGFVHGGQQPITGATIQLYAVGSTGDSSASTPLIPIGKIPVTDVYGAFTLATTFTCPNITTEVYLIAAGGNPGLVPAVNNQQAVLMAALGPCGNITSSTHIIINEATTVGSIYPITAFMSGYLNIGSNSGDANTLAADFMQINEFIDTNGGASPGPALPGGFTAPVANLYTLANSISDCVNSSGGTAVGTPCGNLFAYATPPGGTAPTNTADAVLDIANNPFQNVNSIFQLSLPQPAFQPVLASAPADWTLKILPNVTLAVPSPLVGIGSTSTGTITLGQAAPAGGLTVNLVSSNTSAVTVTTPVIFGAGATSATFSYSGAASAGTAILTASATGYYGSSVTVSSTTSLISLGSIPTVAPGNSTSLPLSLGTPAPAGGVTVSFTSTNPAVATVTGSVFIPAGLQVATTNPQVTGVTVGTASINATATGYAPGTRAVSVSVGASLPNPFSIPIGVTTNELLTISAPAPAGGITFTLTADSSAYFSYPSSIVVPAGNTTVNIPLVGITGGTTNLRADSPNITEAVSAVTVNGTITLQVTAVTTGALLENNSYFYFATAPPTPTTATLTSSNPAIFVASASPTAAGSVAAQIPSITSTAAQYYYIQGISPGSAVLTISATGYTSTTVAITVDPAGFVFATPSFTTTTLSANTSVTLQSYALNPSGLAPLYALPPAPQAGTVSVAVASSVPATGTVSTPAAFSANNSAATVSFKPVAGGSSNLTLTTPSGFSTPNASQQITATVTTPPIAIQTGSLTAGVNLEVQTYAYLTQTPLVPTTVNVTSSNPAVAVASSSATVAGVASLNIASDVSTNAQYFYIQGLSLGTSVFTISASPYSSATITVTVNPSGFILQSGSFSTTSLSVATTLYAQPVVLNSGSLSVLSSGTVAPQIGTVNLGVTSGTPATGTISTSPIAYPAGATSGSTTFQPVGAGTSVVSLATPTGFSTPTPSSTQQLTATVTAPPIAEQGTGLTTGVNMQQQTYAYLTQTPTAPVTVTIVSSNPAAVTVSNGPTIAGAASTTFPNTVTTNALYYQVQGQAVGSSTITVSAPGYTPITTVVTVDPSGFIWQSGSFPTTTFSATSNLYIQPVYLNPGSLAVVGGASLNPGISTVPVVISNSASQVGTVVSPVNFAAGATSAYTTFTPLAAGLTNLTLNTPTGYSTPASSQQITATVSAPPISVQSNALTTGSNLETQTYAYLSQTPPSAVTMNVVIANSAIATLSTSATTAGSGSLTFANLVNGNAQYFYIQGHAVGSTTITISAAGYANNTINVTVDPSGFVLQTGGFSTTTFSPTSNIYVQPVILAPGTLTVIGSAQVAPSAGITGVPITSSLPGIGTVTTPVTFNVGDASDYVVFQPISAGSTNLTLATPAGFMTPSAAATQQITVMVTAPPISVQTNSLNTGLGLQVQSYAYLSQNPPAAVTVTLSSSNPSVVLSKSATAVGTSSLTFTGVGNGSALYYYVQGAGVGSSNITVSAPGFVTATVVVAADPAGFIFQSGNLATTTFSPSSNLYVQPVILSPGTLTVLGGAQIGPGSAVAVPISASPSGVGTISSPIVFNPGDSSDYAVFTPANAGSTTLAIATPGGFTTPSQSATQSITATVTAPPINGQSNTLTTGAFLQIATYAYLSQTPPSAVNVTVTSSNPAVATISTSATAVGTASIVFGTIANSNALYYQIQGQSVGTATITVSAPGFMPYIVTVTVDPSAFVIAGPGNFTTTSGGVATTITVQPAYLNPGVLTVAGTAALNPGIGTVSLTVGSTSPQIGTVSPTTLNFVAGQANTTTSFTPLMAGTTDIDIVAQPSGFTTPSQPATQQIVATVN